MGSLLLLLVFVTSATFAVLWVCKHVRGSLYDEDYDSLDCTEEEGTAGTGGDDEEKLTFKNSGGRYQAQ
jgi:hypothetical protein